MTSDLDLLRQFARENSQDAFTALVNRHLNLVYSAALRQVRSPQLAEEISQSAFADLARNVGKLKADTVLTAWLYAVTRRTAIDVIRKESRRQLREQIAVEMNDMNATANEWTQIEPLLDDALAALDETDRAAILLRYFENKSLREVGESLKISDDAAQKRVSRAVEKLREFFSKQKIAVGASGLAVLISANAVQSAPVTLAKIVGTVALAKSAAAGGSTFILAKEALKLMAWKTKISIVVGTVVLLTAGTVVLSEGWLKRPQEGKTGATAQIMVTTAFVTTSVADADAILMAFSKPQVPTDPASKAFLALIAQHPDATITSTPRVITINGEQAVVSVTRAVEFNGTYTNVGVTLDVMPNLESRAITLKVRAELRELTQETPPAIRLTIVEQTVKLLSGNMVELRKEIAGNTPGQTNSLLIFISPQIVDSRGFPKPH